MLSTLNELFEDQNCQTPDGVCLVHGNYHITYSALNDKANRLAHHLHNLGLKDEITAAICLERSIDLIIGILAVLKAGGAFLLIDPTHPSERLVSILKDSSVPILLTLNKFADKFSKYEGATIKLDLSCNQIANNQNTNLICINKADNIAYIIYTSGTSGQPKGVCSSHSAILNRFHWMWNNYPFQSNDIFCQKTSPNFVDFIWESFGPLLKGIKSIIIDRNIINDHGLLTSCLKKHNITHIVLVPSLVEQFMFNDQNDFLLSLRQLTLSGEKLNANLVNKLKDISSNISILNLYGSSEVAADAMYCDVKRVNWRNNISVIGSPITNINVYILDEYMNPVNIGEIGEICISGMGLARGYLNMPELTATKFVSNPFCNINQKEYQRLYKTGDLGKYLPDGNLEYIGRNDTQVKIRGYRIEVEEIAQILLSYKEIEYCTVLAKGYTHDRYSENKYLIAYYLRKINSSELDTDNFVNDWNVLYQSEYSSLDTNDFINNLQLWKSSYTGAYLSIEEMHEWINCTIQRIKALNPQVILEIGSGTGLILFNLIKDCNHYYALDFSQKASNYVTKISNKLGYNDKVTTIVSCADNIPYDQIDKKYDTIIINSVTQYFPNLDYLSKVIAGVILNFANSGQIFIGDIRDFRLLRCFHHSVQKYKNKNFTKRQIAYFSARDKELLISPEYFLQLKKINKKISYVEILPKLGVVNNEMNNYRYDVILHLNNSTNDYKNHQTVFDVQEDTFIHVIDFEQYLETNSKNDFLFIKYPNARIRQDYQECLKFYNDFLITEEYDKILSLNEMADIVKQKGYEWKCFLDPVEPFYFNILVFRSIGGTEVYLNYHLKHQSSDLSNNPIISSQLIDDKFTKELREYLRERLPEYMMPLYYIPLEKLPLTINGKLDKNALPNLEFDAVSPYVHPKNEVEHKLCKIYSDVLGLPEEIIGISDEFYKLGGNSLLAIRLTSKINEELNLQISLADFLSQQTIESFSNYISIIKENSNSAVLDEGTI